MSIIYIPGPNNEMIPVAPPDTSSRFPISADYAISSSYSETSSFLMGSILSASYAKFAATASYLLGSIANAISARWANFSGHSNTSDTASFSHYADVAGSSGTSNYADTAGSSLYADSSGTALSADTASYVLTASFALTASYVSGLTGTSSYSLYAETASYLGGTASYAMRAETASYADAAEVALRISGGGSAYINAYAVYNVYTASVIDSFPTAQGNSAKWLLSINDGISFKSSEILSIWDGSTNSTNFAEITTNALGSIPVAMSVNISSNSVRLIANPASGSWTVKMIRFLL